MKAISRILGVLSLALGGLSLFRVKSSAGAVLLIPKVVAAALASHVALTGPIGATLGLVRRFPLAIAAGGAGTILGVFILADLAVMVGSVWLVEGAGRGRSHLVALSDGGILRSNKTAADGPGNGDRGDAGGTPFPGNKDNSRDAGYQARGGTRSRQPNGMEDRRRETADVPRAPGIAGCRCGAQPRAATA